jgi:hypothetical protein
MAGLALLEGTTAAIDFTLAFVGSTQVSIKAAFNYISARIQRGFFDQTTFVSSGWVSEITGMKQMLIHLDGYASKAKRKPLAMKLIPGNAQPTERFKMQRAVEYGEPTLDDIADLLYTPAGARDCLKKSLVKSGKSEAEAAEILKKIPPGRAQSLAIDVSGLFECVPPPPQPEQGGKAPDPLARGSASGGVTSPSPTGDGPDSSSPSTSASPSAA